MNEDREDLPVLVRDEFARLGFNAHSRDIVALSDALTAQGAEY